MKVTYTLMFDKRLVENIFSKTKTKEILGRRISKATNKKKKYNMLIYVNVSKPASTVPCIFLGMDVCFLR